MAVPASAPGPSGAGLPTLNKLGWRDILKHKDLLLAIGVALIVSMLIIPIPPFILDILLTVNIALSVTILLVTLYTSEPLQYSTFPTVLLVSTLFRLGLNVSSTRLILLQGHAGDVIQAFGNFVIGGNYVVGLLMFIILIVINFIVITNGAGRVSEVAARFTLDAMPGKQLSIDADLNAGLITEQQAKERRHQIQKEADFHGTMDGASKFVKGDAIAGIIITIINIVGGLIIGVAQLGMSLAESASTYTVLTVGDGLVSQLPALVISTATGILVTRVSSTDNSLGDDLSHQMFGNPKVMGLMAILLFLLALVPGLPTVPFMAIGIVSGGVSWMLLQEEKKLKAQQAVAEAGEKVQKRKKTASDNVMDVLNIDPLEVEVGYKLVTLIEPDSGGDLLDRVSQLRKQIAQELGIILPSIRVRDNLQLPPNHYQIKLRGTVIDSGDIIADMWMAMSTDPDNAEPLNGIPLKEPAFGLPAIWIRDDQRDEAMANGYTVVSASSVVATHLSEVLKRHAADILSRQDVAGLLDHTKKTAESLVADLVPGSISAAELHVVLQNLLREKVSIRDLTTILETVGYHVRVSKDPDYLSEQCRVALSRAICKQHASPESGDLPAVTLAPELEEQLAQGLVSEATALTGSNNSVSAGSALIAVNPQITQKMLKALNQEVEKSLAEHGLQPVILCNARIRLPFRRLTERLLPQIAVLSYNEVGPTTRVQTLGMVRVS
ncbi:MAG: flagellar biosynthesis protein FlhA [Vampirovibrionales bacterium]|nr:flagellar biosynthesis protein FlhA [Vampirovibrionales bacterium]